MLTLDTTLDTLLQRMVTHDNENHEPLEEYSTVTEGDSLKLEVRDESNSNSDCPDMNMSGHYQIQR